MSKCVKSHEYIVRLTTIEGVLKTGLSSVFSYLATRDDVRWVILTVKLIKTDSTNDPILMTSCIHD